MFVKPLYLKYCGPKPWNAVLAVGNTDFGRVVSLIGRAHYSDKSKSKGQEKCCKEVAQNEGKRVEPWPRPDHQPPPLWRAHCPQDPQPPNYDPYRIKVPDVVVPPLPPSNAKEVPPEDGREPTAFPDTKARPHDLFYRAPAAHPDYWRGKERRLQEPLRETLPKLGYHGRTKYKFAFHQPWLPLDRMALLEEAEREESEKTEEDRLLTKSEKRRGL